MISVAVNDAVVAEYVELCEQLAAVALVDQPAEQQLYERLGRLGLLDRGAEQRLCEKLDRLWYAEMTDDDRGAAQGRLAARARRWHDERRTEDS